MNVPLFDLQAQTSVLMESVLDRIRAVCQNGYFALGPFVEQFEAAFADYCEARFCVAVNSGTSAVHLALASLDIGPGDEVITSPMTFVATAWAISYCGATPVFVDIDPATRTLDPRKLRTAITSRTRAIVPVHLYGHPADMAAILEIAEAHGLAVVEDAAQAHGARYQGKRVGGLADVGCFSFYPSKNLGAMGEAGAVVTNDSDIAARIRSLRNHAQGQQRNQHDEIGFNYRMDAFQAAVLLEKLPRLDNWNELRRRHAMAYLQMLRSVSPLRLPTIARDCEHVYHLFVVEADERDRIAQQLNVDGIGTGLHYPTPVHRQPAYARLSLPVGAYPHAEALANRCLSLPMFPELTGQQLRFVSERVQAAAGGKPTTPLSTVVGNCSLNIPMVNS